MEKSHKAIQILRDDHKKIKGLFRQFEGIGLRGDEMKDGVCRQTFMELEIYCHLEETYLYPLLEQNTKNENTRFLIAEGRSTFNTLRNLINELRQIDPGLARFNTRYIELIEEMENHLKREEEDLFTQVQHELPSESLEQIAQEMIDSKSKLLGLPQYQNARPELVQDPNGGEQQRIRSA